VKADAPFFLFLKFKRPGRHRVLFFALLAGGQAKDPQTTGATAPDIDEILWRFRTPQKQGNQTREKNRHGLFADFFDNARPFCPTNGVIELPSPRSTQKRGTKNRGIFWLKVFGHKRLPVIFLCRVFELPLLRNFQKRKKYIQPNKQIEEMKTKTEGGGRP
jgi:hypothetical protein